MSGKKENMNEMKQGDVFTTNSGDLVTITKVIEGKIINDFTGASRLYLTDNKGGWSSAEELRNMILFW